MTLSYVHKDSPLRDGTIKEDVGSPDAVSFLTPTHVFIINAKLYAARDVLAAGFGVFLTDVDVILLQDPRPYFRDVLRTHPDVTMVFQDDTTPVVSESVRSLSFGSASY